MGSIQGAIIIVPPQVELAFERLITFMKKHLRVHMEPLGEEGEGDG